jgi:hypothetical protein
VYVASHIHPVNVLGVKFLSFISQAAYGGFPFLGGNGFNFFALSGSQFGGSLFCAASRADYFAKIVGIVFYSRLLLVL